MKWRFLALLFALCPLAISPAAAESEDAIKEAFVKCGLQQDLEACDALVTMSGMEDVVRSNAYATRAATLTRLGRTDEALKDLGAALKLDPQNRDALMLKIMLLGDAAEGMNCANENADIADRLKDCDTWVASANDDPRLQADALDARAEALADAGRFNDALADLDRADRQGPNRQDAELHRIDVLRLAGDYPKALDVARKAMADSIFDDAGLLAAEGELLYLTGDRAGAVKAFDAAHKADAEQILPAFWGAIIRLELKQDAGNDLRAMLADSRMPPLGRAILRLRLGEVGPDAVLSAATAGSNARCVAYFNIGHDARLRGDQVAARAAFRKAVDTGRVRLPEYRAAKYLLSRL